jgi:hypothetical protein
MSLVVAVAVLVVATLLYTLFVRPADIPAPEPVSPTRHLEERRAAIYENLRDLQFEYRVGKLSDTDYQQTKLSLQKELAIVIGEIEQIVKSSKSQVPVPAKAVIGTAAVGRTMAAAGTAQAPVKAAYTCPHCGAEFPVPLKFCGECGKEMS